MEHCIKADIALGNVRLDVILILMNVQSIAFGIS